MHIGKNTPPLTVGSRFPKWLYLIIPLVSVIATICLVELCLVLFYQIPKSVEVNMFFEPDPFTGYRLAPDSVGYFQEGIAAKTNSMGQRDYEHTLKKPGNVYRVLVIGDSFTIGTNVLQEQAYPKVLEALLNKESGKKIEVINSAVGGWSPFLYAQYYEHYGYAFEPDLILVGFFVGNDTYDQTTRVEDVETAIGGRRVTREAARKQLRTRVKIFLYEHLNIARLLLNGSIKSKAQDIGRLTNSRGNCTDFGGWYVGLQKLRRDNYLKWDKNIESLAMNAVSQIKRIKVMADRSRIPVVVALLPDDTQINPYLRERIFTKDELWRYDFDMPQKMLVGKFKEIGVKTIDLLPAFKADFNCFLYLNDTHWSVAGNELAAEVIFKDLLPFITKAAGAPAGRREPGN